MKRIGLLSDTHIPEAGKALPPMVFQALRGVDLILHAGDLHVLEVLDWLETVSPVLAARGNGDDGFGARPKVPQDPRLKRAQVLQVEGVRLGLVHAVPLPEECPGLDLAGWALGTFGEPVDILVCGDTHVEMACSYDGMLVVNPGSPTLPHQMPGRTGTVGILEVSAREARVSLLLLEGGLPTVGGARYAK